MLSRAGIRWAPVVAALVAALTLAPASPAADPVPSFAASTLKCVPANGLTTRPGDLIYCQLTARVSVTNAYDVTADMTVPAGTTYTPDDVDKGVPNDPVNPTSIFYDTTALGLMNPGFEKVVIIRLRINDDVTPGDLVLPAATLHSSNAPDFSVPAESLPVAPPPADLRSSGMSCADADGAPLVPGDRVDCTIQLTNPVLHENATNLSVTGNVPDKTTWAAGGDETFHTDTTVTWASWTIPGGVPSGGPLPAPLHYRFTVNPATPAGTIVQAGAALNWTSALSGELGSASLVSNQLITGPGPAVLTASTLTCADADGAPLYPGDRLNCRLVATDAAGYEDVDQLTGAAPIPDGTRAPSDAAVGGGAILFDESALGTLPSGASKTVAYALDVAPDAAGGTRITPTATLHGRSVGTNREVSHQLTAASFQVTARPGPEPAPVAAAATSPAPKPATPSTPARNPKICYSRRKITINVAPPRRQRWKSVTLKFAKKTVKAKKTKSRFGTFRAVVTFYGLPKGPITVSIVGKTSKGKTVRRTRHYRLCTKRGAK